MTVMIPVYVQIELDDIATDDPAPGSVLEARMLNSAEEAIQHALQLADETGCEHSLARVASVGFLGTDAPRRIDGVDTHVLTVSSP